MIKTIGEHWVCATPARYGWAPALTRDGLERTDILAVNTDLHHRPVVEIEVKAASQRSEGTNWLLGTKAQFLAKSAHDWFARVLLPEIPAIPRAFVVPRDHLSAAAWIVHHDQRRRPAGRGSVVAADAGAAGPGPGPVHLQLRGLEHERHDQ